MAPGACGKWPSKGEVGNSASRSWEFAGILGRVSEADSSWPLSHIFAQIHVTQVGIGEYISNLGNMHPEDAFKRAWKTIKL